MVARTKTRAFTRIDRVFTSGPSSDASSSINGTLQWVDNKNGSQNPGWRDQILHHRNAGTAFGADSFIVTGATSGMANTVFRRKSIGAAYNAVTRRTSGDILDQSDLPVLNPYVNPSLRSDVHNRALVKFLVACAETQRAFQGGVFLGELRETIRFVKSPAPLLRAVINNYIYDCRRETNALRRRGVIYGTRITDANKVVADTWLRTQYALKPLLHDIADGARALSRLSRRPYDYDIVVVHQEGEGTPAFSTYVKSVNNSVHRWRVRHREAGKIQVRIKGEVKIEVENPMQFRESVLGFSGSDFVPTVYELIPWSFLVDYFSNLGDVLQAWCFPQSDLTWHIRTERNRMIRDTVAVFAASTNNQPNDYIIEQDSGPDLYVQTERRAVSRDVGPLGVPRVTLEIPGSSMKWLNMAALADMRRLPRVA